MNEYKCKNGTVINLAHTVISCYVQHTIKSYDSTGKMFSMNLPSTEWSDFLYKHEQYHLKVKDALKNAKPEQPKI